MRTNRITPIDDVRVEIINSDGKVVDVYQGSGYHTVSEAIMGAYEGTAFAHLDARDYVYNVVNLTTGTENRYRLNAHDHVVLLPEEADQQA